MTSDVSHPPRTDTSATHSPNLSGLSLVALDESKKAASDLFKAVEGTPGWTCPRHGRTGTAWEEIAYLFLLRVFAHRAGITSAQLVKYNECAMRLVSFTAFMSHFQVDRVLEFQLVCANEKTAKTLAAGDSHNPFSASSVACKHRLLRFRMNPNRQSISIECFSCELVDSVIESYSNPFSSQRDVFKMPAIIVKVDTMLFKATRHPATAANVVCCCSNMTKNVTAYNQRVLRHAFDEYDLSGTENSRKWVIDKALDNARNRLIFVNDIDTDKLSLLCAISTPPLVASPSGIQYKIKSAPLRSVTRSPMAPYLEKRRIALEAADADGVDMDEDNTFYLTENKTTTASVYTLKSSSATSNLLVLDQLIHVDAVYGNVYWWKYDAVHPTLFSDAARKTHMNVCLACSHNAASVQDANAYSADKCCMVFDAFNENLFAFCAHVKPSAREEFTFRQLPLCQPHTLDPKTAIQPGLAILDQTK
jgi:hypothetical protein